jgi:hypothetical protein
VVNLICAKFVSDSLCFGQVSIRFWSGRFSVLVRSAGSVLRWLKSRAHGISTGALPEPVHWCCASLLEAALILFFAARQHSCLDFLRSVLFQACSRRLGLGAGEHLHLAHLVPSSTSAMRCLPIWPAFGACCTGEQPHRTWLPVRSAACSSDLFFCVRRFSVRDSGLEVQLA